MKTTSARNKEAVEVALILKSKLAAWSEVERIESAKGDKRSNLEFLAIKVPLLRKLASSLISQTSRESGIRLAAPVLIAVWRASSVFEVKSCILYFLEEELERIDGVLKASDSLAFLDSTENWAHADQMSSLLASYAELNRDRVLHLSDYLAMSSNPWSRRISLVSLVRYTGKNAVYLPWKEMSDRVARMTGDEHVYVKRAVGWVLREASVKYPNEVEQFKSANILSSVSKRWMFSQKARRSSIRSDFA